MSDRRVLDRILANPPEWHKTDATRVRVGIYECWCGEKFAMRYKMVPKGGPDTMEFYDIRGEIIPATVDAIEGHELCQENVERNQRMRRWRLRWPGRPVF